MTSVHPGTWASCPRCSKVRDVGITKWDTLNWAPNIENGGKIFVLPPFVFLSSPMWLCIDER